jgi:ParB family chromosome partitioning protein
MNTLTMTKNAPTTTLDTTLETTMTTTHAATLADTTPAAAIDLSGIPLEFPADFAAGSVNKAMANSTKGAMWKVPVGDLHVMPGLNVRGDSEAYRARVSRLARSIFAEGFYPDKALAVFVDSEGKIMVRDGHTRLLAVKEAIGMGAQITTLPCVTALPGSTMEDFTVGLVKSNEGAPLLPIEVAIVCKRLVGWGMSPAKVAERLDYTTRYVEELLGLLAAPSALVTLVKEGTVSASTAMKAIKQKGAKKAAEVIVEAAQAAPKGKKVTDKTIAAPAAKKAPKALPKATSVDPMVALKAVFNDPSFNKLADKVQQMVLELVG